MNARTFDITISSGRRTLVDVKNFRIRQERLTFLFGESGIGKSLSAQAIYGLLDPDLLGVRINREPYVLYLQKEESNNIRRNGFFVFQEPSSHLNPLMPLGSQLREGSLAQARSETELLQSMWDTTDAADLQRLLEVYPKPHRPSGGEKQRMLLVMALMKLDIMIETETSGADMLFVFDEPTGSLDNHFRDIFVGLLFRRFRRRPFTAVLITHDYSMVGLVTRTYPDQLGSVVFEELRLMGGELQLREFRPEVYRKWLSSRRPISLKGNEEQNPLLRMESGAVVFGKELVISQDAGGRSVSPLMVFPGRLTYLKARSGVGKTTLLKTIMGLTSAEKFDVRLNGLRLTDETPKKKWRKEIWGRKLTMVFQHADEALNPNSRVKDVFKGLPTAKVFSREVIIEKLTELFDMEIGDEFLNKQVKGLSGGQKQKLNLIRALSLDTEVLLLDEPLNGLDFESMTVVLSLLKKKQKMGKGILLVTHNEEIVSTMAAEEDVYYLHSR